VTLLEDAVSNSNTSNDNTAAHKQMTAIPNFSQPVVPSTTDDEER